MTDDILFKAKMVEDGEWVTGYYVYDACSGRHLIYSNVIYGDLSLFSHVVDGESVRQYTGFVDRGGAKIFVGDSCKIVDVDEEDHYYKVAWDDTRGVLVAKFIDDVDVEFVEVREGCEVI